MLVFLYCVALPVVFVSPAGSPYNTVRLLVSKVFWIFFQWYCIFKL